jgi:hypothetical protein
MHIRRIQGFLLFDGLGFRFLSFCRSQLSSSSRKRSDPARDKRVVIVFGARGRLIWQWRGRAGCAGGAADESGAAALPLLCNCPSTNDGNLCGQVAVFLFQHLRLLCPDFDGAFPDSTVADSIVKIHDGDPAAVSEINTLIISHAYVVHHSTSSDNQPLPHG